MKTPDEKHGKSHEAKTAPETTLAAATEDSTVEIRRLRQILEEEFGRTLIPMSPREAQREFLRHKASECALSTHQAYRTRTNKFVEWCGEQGIDNLNLLTGRCLESYRNWRRESTGHKPISEKTQQDTLRVFIRYCESIEAVVPGLSQKILSPTIRSGEGAREVMVNAETARDVLQYLEKYEFASTEHVFWLLVCGTGARLGTLRALDVEDFHVKGQFLSVSDRPEQDTPLKNAKKAERLISLSRHHCGVIEDYLRNKRPNVVDEFGRQPLLATEEGRISPSTIRKYAYKLTRPCYIGHPCPHSRAVEECEAANKADCAYKCPSSLSPHPARRGYITHELRSGTPISTVSERCNVSEQVIRKHYDQRTELEKMELRRAQLDEIHRNIPEFAG